MKKIYIVLTYTGTYLARLVKFYTKNEFSHVSIALDKELETMYSFGRLNAYNPFIGGFVKESTEYGTFKRFKKTKSNVLSLEIDDEKYKKLYDLIKDVENKKSNYKFNVLGLFLVTLHLKIKRDKYFYCAEFIKYLLEESNIEKELPKFVKPEDFKNIKNIHEEYYGILNKYKESCS